MLIHSAAALDLRDFVPRVDCLAPCSAIIGSVEIVDCIRNSPSPWAFAGFWHWVLRDPVLFERPILDIRGALSFWDVPEGVSIPAS